MDAPSAKELVNHPLVQAALSKAWIDSKSDDPDHRHEEGGWIYMSVVLDVRINHANPGVQSAIDLSDPPLIEGYFVVGKFHTHPNPSSEGWTPGSSQADYKVDELHGVPDLIVADNGVFIQVQTVAVEA